MDTHNANYPNGGNRYTSHVYVHERFVFLISDAILCNLVAPMFWTGLNVYFPMVRHGCRFGKEVAIVGIVGISSY